MFNTTTSTSIYTTACTTVYTTAYTTIYTKNTTTSCIATKTTTSTSINAKSSSISTSKEGCTKKSREWYWRCVQKCECRICTRIYSSSNCVGKNHYRVLPGQFEGCRQLVSNQHICDMRKNHMHIFVDYQLTEGVINRTYDVPHVKERHNEILKQNYF